MSLVWCYEFDTVKTGLVFFLNPGYLSLVIYTLDLSREKFLSIPIMTGALRIVTRRAEFFHSESKQKTKGENITVKAATVFGTPLE